VAITSYTVPGSDGVNTTSSSSELVHDWAEKPPAGIAASRVAWSEYSVSTAVPPEVVYRFSSLPEPAGFDALVDAAVLGAVAGADGAVDLPGAADADDVGPAGGLVAARVTVAAEPKDVDEAYGVGAIRLEVALPAEAASCTGQAAIVATCGPAVAVGITESSPAQTTPIAVAVAAAQATTAYTDRFDGTSAALLPGAPAPAQPRPPSIDWRRAVDPLGCHTMARVLLVEDDPDIRSTVIRQLSEFGHSVRSAGTALAALREATKDPGDVIVLDLGLPDLDGSEALKMMRAVTSVPVIIATARDDEAEIIRLLHAGADDYLVKPYSAAHLAARIAAVLRRAGAGAVPSALRVGGLEIDPRRRQAQLDGKKLDLSRREFDLLAYLAARPGEVVTRRELLSEVWQLPYGDDQTIDVHLSWLRRKLGERASRPRYLHTVRGVGVRLVDPSVEAGP
jgi:DNA-binding response OmpR family regulator